MDKVVAFYGHKSLSRHIRIMLFHVAKACTCLWVQKQSNINFDGFSHGSNYGNLHLLTTSTLRLY